MRRRSTTTATAARARTATTPTATNPTRPWRGPSAAALEGHPEPVIVSTPGWRCSARSTPGWPCTIVWGDASGAAPEASSVTPGRRG